MDDNRINELMDTTVGKIRQLVDSNTIIGEPIVTPDGITVIPVSRVSFGFATGGASGQKNVSFTGANGAGVKVEPIGFFVIKDGNCRMINVAPPPSNTVERVVEMVPDILDRIEAMTKKD
ncbi:MAG: GerW family sporulation protein [Oscillospiraceae bacterium]|nr:GerW family sporulation protein [Oscillospiraceae bacterium]